MDTSTETLLLIVTSVVWLFMSALYAVCTVF